MVDEIDILTLGTERLWNIYKKEVEMDDPDFTRVRKGVNINFDIIDYLQGFGVGVKEKIGKIKIGRILYVKEEIDTEILTREKIMSEFLINRFRKGALGLIRSRK